MALLWASQAPPPFEKTGRRGEGRSRGSVIYPSYLPRRDERVTGIDRFLDRFLLRISNQVEGFMTRKRAVKVEESGANDASWKFDSDSLDKHRFLLLS